MLKHRTQSTALVPIDDDVDNLPFIVRFATAPSLRRSPGRQRRSKGAEMRSWNDESRFTVHTAADVIVAY